MARRRETGWPATPEPLPLPVVDDHTHLESVLEWEAPGWDAPSYSDDPTPRVDHPTLTQQLARARAVGVDRVVQVGCDLDSVRWTDELLRTHAATGRLAGVGLLGAVAIHPNEAVRHCGIAEIAPDGLEPAQHGRYDVAYEDAFDVVSRVARENPRIRAVGETGLDHFRAGERGREVQRAAFRDHIALAKELDLPLQIHDRDAHAEIVQVLLADGAPERTVFHCFSGDLALARTCAEHGWYLSISGTVTFRANEEARRVVAEVPLELLLTETDAPYLTPHPYRGRPNAPYLLPQTVREIAASRGEDLARVCEVTAATAQALYGPW